MSGRRVFRHVVGVVIVTAATVPLAAIPASAAPARIVQARKTLSVSLPSGTKQKVVQSVTLASGPWTVISRAFVVNSANGESDYFRCALFDETANTELDRSAAWVATDYPGNMITNLAKVKVAQGTTTTVDQRCWHDHFGISDAFLQAQATLLAFKALSASGNRVHRSTAVTDLPSFGNGERPKTVGTVLLTKGTWVLGLKATAVLGTGTDWVECQLPGGGNFSVDAGVGGDSGWSRASTFAAFTVYTTTFDEEFVTAKCSAYDGTNSYLDPGVELWARKVSSAFIGNTCGTVTPDAATDAVADIRTTACGIPSGTGTTQTGGATISKGSWVAVGAEQSLIAGAQQFIQCGATDVTDDRRIDEGAGAWAMNALGKSFGYTDTTYLGKLTVSSAATVEFRCFQPASSGIDSLQGSYILLRP